MLVLLSCSFVFLLHLFLGLIKIYYLGPAFLKQADFYKYTKYIKEGVRVRKSDMKH